MTRVKLTQKGAVRLALVLQDVLDTSDMDRGGWAEKYEEVIRVVDAVLRQVDGVVEGWEPDAPDDDHPRERVPAAG